MRGRKPVGPEIVEQLAGSAQAGERLQTILETMFGTLRVQEACQHLGISAARFHELRRIGLQGAKAALEPRPAGRPARAALAGTAEQVEALTRQVEALTEQVEQLQGELKTALLRAEIALILPGSTGRIEPEEKKTTGARRGAKRPRRS